MNRSVVTALCGSVVLLVGGVCVGRPWYIQTVDSSGNTGSSSSLAIDPSGYPHISYHDRANSDLQYAAWNGTCWDIQTVDSSGSVGSHTSLALDANGHPHISYQGGGDLKYAAWNGTGWDIQTADDSFWVGWYTSLALDSNDYPHISYYAQVSGNLKYAAWTGTGWDVQTVDSTGDVGEYSSLALGSNDYPRISYRDFSDGDLKYAAWNGSTWNIQSVYAGGSFCSLALDSADHPHITQGGWLRYAAWNGTSWEHTILDSSRLYYDTSLALDASGYGRVAYRDQSNGDLKYAFRTGSASWYRETVDSAGDVGSYPSLDLDASGYPHISYYDQTNGDLKYATERPPTQASHTLGAIGYYMISLPFTPDSPTVHRLLCDDLGHGNYYMWGWNGSGYETIPTSPPGCEGTTLNVEQGYWLLAPVGTLDIDVGGTLPHGDQAIPLQAGWNMVGAAYNTAIDSLQVDNGAEVKSLAEAQAAGWVLATFYYSHNGTGSYSTVTISQSPADELSVWYGYWVLAGIDCSLIVPEPSGGAGGTAIRAAEAALQQPGWSLDIRASDGSSTDSITIATADGASDDFDGFALDKPKPPVPPGESRLRMALKQDDAARGRVPWASQLAMETKSTAQEPAEWHFTVTGGVQGETVAVTWPGLSQLPKDRVAILTDLDSGKRTFMRSRGQYEFAAPGEDSARHLAVTVKPAEDGALLISGLTASPTRGGAWDIGFNLSGDAALTARIYNVAGRLVATIAQAQQLARGRGSLNWNGRSAIGTAVPGGTYLLRVTARTAEGQQASAVTRLRINR